jgi:hypothetical protein
LIPTDDIDADVNIPSDLDLEPNDDTHVAGDGSEDVDEDIDDNVNDEFEPAVVNDQLQVSDQEDEPAAFDDFIETNDKGSNNDEDEVDDEVKYDDDGDGDGDGASSNNNESIRVEAAAEEEKPAAFLDNSAKYVKPTVMDSIKLSNYNRQPDESGADVLYRYFTLMIICWAASSGVTSNAIDTLLSFLSTFFNLFLRTHFDTSTSSSSKLSVSSSSSSSTPGTLHSARRMLKLDAFRKGYTEYVYCRKCSSIFDLSTDKKLQQLVSQGKFECPFEFTIEAEGQCTTCDYRLFDSSTVRQANKHTGRTDNSKIDDLHPFLARMTEKAVIRDPFPYHSLLLGLYELINRPGIERQMTRHWRERQAVINKQNAMFDVFDGRMWRDYQTRWLPPEKYKWYMDGDFDSEKWLPNEQHFYSGEDANVIKEGDDATRWREVDLLADEKMIGLGLHEDGISPNKKNQYSTGLLYIILLNLPRKARYRRENMILVGCIPKRLPKGEVDTEGFSSIQSILNLLVADLLPLLDPRGYEFSSSFESPDKPIRYRAMLMLIICDMPASRDVGGFPYHNHKYFCNKCMEKLTNKRVNHPPNCQTQRTESTHRKHAWTYHEQANENKDVKKGLYFKDKYGVVWCAFLLLPYYDPIRMIAIDAMHNIFLGMGKDFIYHLTTHKCRKLKLKQKPLKNNKPRVPKHTMVPVLTKKQMKQMDEFIKDIQAPSDLGRIPRKIGSQFSNITADELKLFILYYSLPLFRRLKVDNRVIGAWKPFVYACAILCQRSITADDAMKAQVMLQRFCSLITLEDEDKTFRGSSLWMVKPNHHLGAYHLADMILDWGPVIAYWSFALERFNGEMADAHHNGSHIEVALMRSNLHTRRAITLLLLEREYAEKHPSSDRPSVEHYQSILDHYAYLDLHDTAAFNLPASSYEYMQHLAAFSLGKGNSNPDVIQRVLASVDLTAPIVPLEPLVSHYMSSPLLHAVSTYYRHRYPNCSVDPLPFAQKFGRLQIFDDQFGSVSSRGNRSSYVTAYKCLRTPGGVSKYVKAVGNIQGFLKHKAEITTYSDAEKTQVASTTVAPTFLAVIVWYLPTTLDNLEAFETAAEAAPERLPRLRAEKDHLYATVIVKPKKEEVNSGNMDRSVIPVTHIIQRVMLSPWQEQTNQFCAVPILRKLEG